MSESLIKGLVSVVTPCYNTGGYIHRLLDSILLQTYPYIQMIVVDDGSTDNSKQVVEKYIPLFEEKGYQLSYIYQKNQGQSVAIQTGLGYVDGEFLVWPDSDDFYSSKDSIKRMVDVLKCASDEIGIVRTQENLVKDGNLDHVITVFGKNANELEPFELFEDCLYTANQYFYCPGAYMIRMRCLLMSTSLPIYTSKDAGQNWQLMLPILYKYRCMTILEPLYSVVERVSSHSRGSVDTDEKWLKRRDTYCDTIIGTLDRIKGMGVEERHKYKNDIERKYFFEKLDFCIDKGYINKMKAILKEKNNIWEIGKKRRIKIFLLNFHLLGIYRKCRALLS